MWQPPKGTTGASSSQKEYLATAGDYLRVWSINNDNQGELKALLNNNKHTGIVYACYYMYYVFCSVYVMLLHAMLYCRLHVMLYCLCNAAPCYAISIEYCAPLTSFDWNETDPSMIGTCSIDTTVTIWDVNTMTPKTQLIAHDKEVFDIGFVPNDVNVFATAGADGSVRLFDLR